MQFHGNLIPAEEDPMYIWRIKSQGNGEARQQFLDGYVPQIWELADRSGPEAAQGRRRREFTEPDWDELKHVVTGHGPTTQERLELREAARAETEWGPPHRACRSGVTVYEVFRMERRQPSSRMPE